MSDIELSGASDEDSINNNDGDMFNLTECTADATNGVKRRHSDDESSGINSKSNAKSGQKKRKLKKANEIKKLNKPPTVEELNRLRETENLFHSNLFRQQIDEMLTELKLKNSYQVCVNAWFEKFNDWVRKTEDSDDSYELSNTAWIKTRKFKVPLTQFSNQPKGVYRFRKPSKIQMIGSYVAKTMLGTGNIDIVVEMPQQFFDKEDYLNGRYYRKRALYLCELAKHLHVMTELVQEVKFATKDGDSWRPVLEITPAGKLGKSTKFVIHVVADKNTFRSNRFIPTRNNVRCRWFFEDNSDLDDADYPTPEYNSGVLRDLRCIDNEDLITEVLGKSSQLRDAVILLKVWARQRELSMGYGGFTGHLFSLIVVYLLNIHKLNLTMSSYQVIRTVWNYLGSSDWARNGITLCDTVVDQQPTLSEFHDHFPLVFVDPSGFLNLCAGMPHAVFHLVQDEAALALRCLDTPDINCFQVLFMTPAPFSRLCDQSIVFHNWDSLKKFGVEHSQDKKKLDYCGMIYPQVRDLLFSLLKRGLGERVRRLFIKQTPFKTWSIDKKPRDASVLTLGLLLNSEHCFNVVDKGPVADDKEAEEFRAFWKERSELRRFKDGTITESVLWDAQTWPEKRMICRQVSQYLLKSKFGLEPSDYHYVGDEIESILPKDRETNTGNVLTAFDNLTKALRNLKDLPLNVISVQGACSVFSHTDIFPPSIPKEHTKGEKIQDVCAMVDPMAHVAPTWCAPADVVIQLGTSNKWPRDLGAVRRIRAAFNLKISELLSEEGSFITQAYQDGVDVRTDTCVFRLRIVYLGEIALMKKTLAPDGLVLYRDTEESIKFEKTAIHLPKLTSALNGLQSQHSSYGTACCLAKRWVRAHLFHPVHISDEVVDLVMASVYVNPEPWQPPNQPQLAFLRFLSLLAHTNWNIEFIFLNFNQVLSRDVKHEIESNFDSNRATLPCMFIATPDDRTRSVWTRDGPCPVVLLRLVSLAQRALELLEAQIFGDPNPDIFPLFQPSLTVYDAIITLISGFIPKKSQAISALNNVPAKGKGDPLGKIIPVLGFDPVECYIKELRETYGEWAMFFYDAYGGTSIGVLWKPGSRQPREFKVSHLHGRRWERSTNMLQFDTDAVLEGFYVLGGGLVKSVQIKKEEKFIPVHL